MNFIQKLTTTIFLAFVSGGLSAAPVVDLKIYYINGIQNSAADAAKGAKDLSNVVSDLTGGLQASNLYNPIGNYSGALNGIVPGAVNTNLQAQYNCDTVFNDEVFRLYKDPVTTEFIWLPVTANSTPATVTHTSGPIETEVRKIKTCLGADLGELAKSKINEEKYHADFSSKFLASKINTQSKLAADAFIRDFFPGEDPVITITANQIALTVKDDVLKGKKVILIAHSQGNLIANLAWVKLVLDLTPVQLGQIRILNIANTSRFAVHGADITHNNDIEIYKLLPGLGINNPRQTPDCTKTTRPSCLFTVSTPATAIDTSGILTAVESVDNHNFVATYLSGSSITFGGISTSFANAFWGQIKSAMISLGLTPAHLPRLTQVTCTSAAVGSPVSCSVDGQNLQLLGIGAKLGSATCTAAAATSDAARVFTCTPNASGSLTFQLTINGNPVAGASSIISNSPLTGPVISTQPTSRTVTVGSPVSFAVQASGTGVLSYQWKKNGVNIASATASSYSIASAAGADAGNYTVAVSNSGGTTTSAIAALVVTTTPTVTPTFTASKLPHTGITASQCYEAGSDVLVSCASAGALALNSQQDGMLTNVNPMTYSMVPNPSGGSFPITSCVKDNVTGLMWEGKEASGTRAGSNSYTNYDSAYGSTTAQMDAASNTYGYVNAVNALALCGYTDWRLPTADELQGIVEYGRLSPAPSININWFPNTQSNVYWASSPYAGDSAYAWGVDFGNGYVDDYFRNSTFHVRLVRASQ